MKKSSDPMVNKTRDFPALSAVPQPTAPTMYPQENLGKFEIHWDTSEGGMWQ
jgi:hypothetical protein